MAKKTKINRLNFSYFFSVSFLSLLAVFLFSTNKAFYYQPQQLVVERSKCDVPLAPQNPKAVAGPNYGQVLLSWDKVNGADYYAIMYGPKSLDYQWGAANVGNVDHYVVSGLNPGSAYYFIINAVNNCGSSPSVKEVAAFAAKPKIAPKQKKGSQPSIAPQPSVLTSPKPIATPSAKKIVLQFSPKPSPIFSPSPGSIFNQPIGIGVSKVLNFLNIFKWLILAILLLAFLAWYGGRLIKEEKDTRYKKPDNKPVKPQPVSPKPKTEVSKPPVEELFPPPADKK